MIRLRKDSDFLPATAGPSTFLLPKSFCQSQEAALLRQRCGGWEVSLPKVSLVTIWKEGQSNTPAPSPSDETGLRLGCHSSPQVSPEGAELQLLSVAGQMSAPFLLPFFPGTPSQSPA